MRDDNWISPTLNWHYKWISPQNWHDIWMSKGTCMKTKCSSNLHNKWMSPPTLLGKRISPPNWHYNYRLPVVKNACPYLFSWLSMYALYMYDSINKNLAQTLWRRFSSWPEEGFSNPGINRVMKVCMSCNCPKWTRYLHLFNGADWLVDTIKESNLLLYLCRST